MNTDDQDDRRRTDEGATDDGHEPTRPLAYASAGTAPPPRGPDVDETEPLRPKPPLIGPGRHLISVVVALVLTPIALTLLDFAYSRWFVRFGTGRLDSTDTRALIAIGAAAFLLFLTVLAARVSPLGPLVAGLVWGVGPWIAVTFSTRDVVRHIKDLPNLYDRIGLSVAVYGFVLYAAVAALLIGAGFGASWRKSR